METIDCNISIGIYQICAHLYSEACEDNSMSLQIVLALVKLEFYYKPDSYIHVVCNLWALYAYQIDYES